MTTGIDAGELLKPIVEVLWKQVALPACLILLSGIIFMGILYLIRRRKSEREAGGHDEQG